MMLLKIKFVDFWFGFQQDNNYLFNLLSSSYILEFSDNPHVLIYSCYGQEYLKYNCIKVFYTAENLRPDFLGCDFAIGFDYNNDSRYYRLPLYALHLDSEGSIKKMIEEKSRESALKIWRQKTKFCCMVVSNGQSKKRLQFFEKLSKYKTVDSGGMIMNNVGGAVKDKMTFIRDYRFVVAFENASYPGYTTEKLIEPFLSDCIPLYWGNPIVEKDFNANCFLNLDSSKSEEKFIEEIIAIDKDEEKAIKMLMNSKFFNRVIPEEMIKENLNKFFERIIIFSANKTPVAKTWKKYIHLYRVKKNHYYSSIIGKVKKITSSITI